ncbi:MAG: cytochrome c biogenesis protein ResB, partial [Pyrinomonadaceae bacterium]
ITLEVTPENGGAASKIDIARGGSANLSDGTKIDFEQFLPDFALGAGGRPDTRSGEYLNPAAVLSVTRPQAEKERVFAFASKLADNIPIGAPKLGYKWRLASFEKSPLAHILSIKYDPYNGAFIAWYFGGFGLIGALIFVFFVSHKRVWAFIEESSAGTYEVTLGGDANRNQLGFEDKFTKIVDDLKSDKGETPWKK